MSAFKSFTCSYCKLCDGLNSCELDTKGSHAYLSCYSNQTHQIQQCQSVLSWTKKMWLRHFRHSIHGSWCFVCFGFVSFRLNNRILVPKFCPSFYWYLDYLWETQLFEWDLQRWVLMLCWPVRKKLSYQNLYVLSKQPVERLLILNGATKHSFSPKLFSKLDGVDRPWRRPNISASRFGTLSSVVYHWK